MRRILVGYDASDGARRALDRAIEEAHEHKARVTVLSVEPMPLDPTGPRNFGTAGDISAWEDAPIQPPPDVVEHLTDAAGRLKAAGLDPELTWAAGEPARLIVDTAKEIGASTIILGEHHHGMLSSFFGGDVDAEVRREAGCDVILA